jgi:adenine-specific DNA-methyltransferase
LLAGSKSMGFRYIGTKTQIIDALCQKIADIVGPGACVADLMCGTATVSAALRQLGYRVIANDVMTYSYHHARVMLFFTAEPDFAGAERFVEEFGSRDRTSLLALSPYERMISALGGVPSEQGYFWREFSPAGKPKNSDRSRNYFSPHNAAKVDGIRKCIRQLRNDSRITELEHSLLLHDLIMAANDVANIAGTYGHYLSELRGRSKTELVMQPTVLLTLDDAGQHAVTRGYAEEVAPDIECDLCYIDPPYMKRQYAANYHVLETLAREDEPEAVGASGLRPWRDQYSDFCTKTRIREAFAKVLSRMQCHHFLVSYSEDGLLALEELEALFAGFGAVQTTALSNKRFKSNNSSLAPRLTEYLIHVVTR